MIGLSRLKALFSPPSVDQLEPRRLGLLQWLNIVLSHPVISKDSVLRFFFDNLDDNYCQLQSILYGSDNSQLVMSDARPEMEIVAPHDEVIPEWDVWNEAQSWTDCALDNLKDIDGILSKLSKNYQSMASSICGLTLKLPAISTDQLSFTRTEALVRSMSIRPVPNFNVGCRLESLNELGQSLMILLKGLGSMLFRQKKLLIEEHKQIHILHMNNQTGPTPVVEDVNIVRFNRGSWIERKRFAEEKIIAEKNYVKDVVDNGLHQILLEISHFIETP